MKGGNKTEMATLAELIKGFRSNVRAGYPCELRFDGRRVYLTVNPINSYGFVGMTKPSIAKGFLAREKELMRSSAEVDEMPDTLSYASTSIPKPEY